FFCFFFFSSRRRHTRSKRDWSSDVCSSDLRSQQLPSSFFILRSSSLNKQRQYTYSCTLTTSSAYLNQTVASSATIMGDNDTNRRSEERRVGKERKTRRAPGK